jgi:hypothetical protein
LRGSVGQQIGEAADAGWREFSHQAYPPVPRKRGMFGPEKAGQSAPEGRGKTGRKRRTVERHIVLANERRGPVLTRQIRCQSQMAAYGNDLANSSGG